MNVNRVPRTLPRREFLRLGSTAVVGVAAAGLFDFNSLFAEAASLPLLSIGFAGSVPEAGRAIGLTAASSLLTSDPAFLGRGARLRIAGFARSSNAIDRPGGVHFDAIFPTRTRSGRLARFAAWSFNGRDNDVAFGNQVSFTMPVTSTEGLRFSVHRQRLEAKAERVDETMPAEPDATEQNMISLSVNSGGDAMLQRGVYVFAFRETPADRAPAWSRLGLSNDGGALKIEGLDLSYMALVVDYNS